MTRSPAGKENRGSAVEWLLDTELSLAMARGLPGCIEEKNPFGYMRTFRPLAFP